MINSQKINTDDMPIITTQEEIDDKGVNPENVVEDTVPSAVVASENPQLS